MFGKGRFAQYRGNGPDYTICIQARLTQELFATAVLQEVIRQAEVDDLERVRLFSQPLTDGAARTAVHRIVFQGDQQLVLGRELGQ